MASYKIKEKKLLFYGAGTIAHFLFLELKEELSACFSGFIDLRAETLETKDGYPVFSLEQCGEFLQKDDFVIFITTRNVFEHSKIADVFLDQGFHNLIFKPLSLLKGGENETLMGISTTHDSFLVNFSVPEGSIPTYEKKILPSLEDSAFLEEHDGMIKAYLPASLLFTNQKITHRPPMAVDHCHFASCYLAVDLYRAFGENTGWDSIDLYMEEIGRVGAEMCDTDTSGQWAEILLDARQEVYEQMNQALALDYDFFLRHPTTVSYNQKGQLSLVASGKNRVSFLIGKGYDFIPALISKEDYAVFLQDTKRKQVETLLKQLEITEMYAPVPHPYFYKYPTVIPQYCRVFLDRLAHHIGRYLLKTTGFYDFSKISVLSCLLDQGSAGRYFSVLGAEVYTKELSDLEQALNELLYTKVAVWDKRQVSLLLISLENQSTGLKFLQEVNPQFCCVLSVGEQIPVISGYEKVAVLFQRVMNRVYTTGVLYQKGG